MSRTTETGHSPLDPIAVAVRVAGALDALGVAQTIGGSIASSIAGEPRSTLDIDFVAALEDMHVTPLVAMLQGEFYVDEDALRRAVDLGGRTLFVHPPEDILLQKLRWFRLGGETSDHHLRSNGPALGVADLVDRALAAA